VGREIVDVREKRPRVHVVRPRHDPERALTGGGKHHVLGEHLDDLVQPRETGEPGPGEHQRVPLALTQPSQARVHVAPRRLDHELRPRGEDLGGPSRARGPDPASRG